MVLTPTFSAALARGERTSSHNFVRNGAYHIIRESRQHAESYRLPSSAPRGRGRLVDIVISDAAAGHTLVDIVVAGPYLS